MNQHINKPIILASVSPRRRQAFKLLNVPFRAVESGYEEVMDQRMKHEDMVVFLALGKAKAAAKKYPTALIVTADTIVSFGGLALGKPKTAGEAAKMLAALAGKWHRVVTGAVVMDAATGRLRRRVCINRVKFKKLSSGDIRKYVRLEHPYDKAGGYNLQNRGLELIEKFEGEFSNNLGLPLDFVFNSLAALTAG
ncbi:MAG TPA: Maf family nucleotide pyrophosphatase [Patescibacteria group bacterium]|nr:Maf family nucleotide pyrophosphatase [Patescibacteria group bacterium]